MPHARKASKAPAVEKTAKLKMSNTKFRVLIIIPMVVVALVAILVTAANLLTSTLDTYLGKGETYVETPSDKTSWDSTYYDVQVAQGEE